MGARSIERAAARLQEGGLVIYPTDTLYGIGADAFNAAAVERLIEVKGRSARQPISLAVSSFEELESLARISNPVRAFLRSNLPGPLTVLLPPAPGLERRGLAAPILGGRETIGVRLPDHPLARALAQAVGPITATSANRHGEKPCRTIAEARRTFGDAIDLYVDGPPRPRGVPSNLVDLSGPGGPRLRSR